MASPAPEPAARRTLRARLRGGPVARAVGRLDLRVYRVLRTRGHDPGAERLVAAYSRLGEHAGAWLLLGLAGALLDTPRRSRWHRATVTVGGAYGLNTALKVVVRRKRPLLEELPALIATPTSLSFPSAHACSSFAAARAFGPLGLPAPPLYAAATAMAVSRVYLGVHYPSDIAVGALVGAAIGSAGR